MKKITRREMLKKSGAFGAGVMVLTNGILAKGQSPNEKLNLALIGIGGQGGFQVNHLKSENYVALCDVDDVRAGKVYEQYPNARKFYDFRKLFDEMENQIDAVAISTPDHTHYHPVMRALRAGKHVYCEKPLAHSVAECRIITDTAAEMKLATQIGAQRHAYANMHRVVELIKSGAIGKVETVYSWIGGTRGMPEVPTKFVDPPSTIKWDLWQGPAVKDRKFSYSKALNGKEEPTFAPYNWRFWWDYGTAETGNWACHILDLPYWALDLKYPIHVSARGPEVDPERTPNEMHMKYQFPARGELGPLTLYWSHGARAPWANLVSSFKLKDGKTKSGWNLGDANNLFVGTKGMLIAGFGKHALLPEEDFVDFQYPEKFIPDSPGFHKEWINACKGGEKATCDFSYSGPMAETAILGNTAFRAGHKSFEWDAANLVAKNCPEVQAALKPEFRKGWDW